MRTASTRIGSISSLPAPTWLAEMMEAPTTAFVPFTGHVPGGTDWNHYDLTTPNEAFFARVDQMIKLAAKHKILIILDPAETIAWLPALLNNGPARCRAYGRYLGRRYKNFDNILWMSGNDFGGLARSEERCRRHGRGAGHQGHGRSPHPHR